MRRVSISELKARLSAWLDVVRAGDDVLVTDRGRPIARIAPVEGERLEESRRELLIRTGRIKPPSSKLPRDFWTRSRPSDPKGRSIDVVLKERGESG